MRRRAYTLVEVLAVTVLLGVLATLGVPPMLRAMAGDPLERAAAQLARGYRDARAQAFGRRLDLELASWGFAAASADGGRLAPTRLPDEFQVSWTRNGKPVPQHGIDARGHALDLDVAVRDADRELFYTVDGLTGRWSPGRRP